MDLQSARESARRGLGGPLRIEASEPLDPGELARVSALCGGAPTEKAAWVLTRDLRPAAGAVRAKCPWARPGYNNVLLWEGGRCSLFLSG